MERALDDTQMKMLNLTHDWLKTFLPHTLCKINRVHFGLLSPSDLERAMRIDPNMPEARKLVAVPFVGKDVPSRASEFAHPDVVIGLTVIAFRFDGLRLTDFIAVLRELRARMSTETGPYAKRSACLQYVQWVKCAGGRVRGTSHDQQQGAAGPGAGPGGGGGSGAGVQSLVKRAAYHGGQRSDFATRTPALKGQIGQK